MQFNSIGFLFVFFPLFLTLWFVLREELRRPVVILGSLAFCALASNGNYWWVGILVLITLGSYLVQAVPGEHSRRRGTVLFLLLMAAVLVFFKIFAGGTLLPAGMSFYMFQIAACLIDVCRGRIPAEKSFFAYMEQIVLFPKLLSGPLMAPEDLRIQQAGAERSFRNIYEGLRIFILGLAIKVILANRLGGLWSQPRVMGYAYISTPAAWMAIVGYTMQLYLDFYGYSLMAIGIGKMLGWDLPANFRDPYASKTVSEFYRRWHITLGAWFREYIYIPLGGNRKGLLRTCLNIAVVWLFTGLWHGIGGNYLLWAGFICLLILNERLWLGKLLNKSRVLCHVYLVFVIILSWIPFAVGEWDQMVLFLCRLFGRGGSAANPRDYVEWLEMYTGLLLTGGFVMTPLAGKLWNRLRDTVLADLLVFVLFWVSVYFIATAAQDPFLYFQY